MKILEIDVLLGVRILLCIYIVLITTFALIPSPQTKSLFFLSDKIAHFLSFFILWMLVHRSFQNGLSLRFFSILMIYAFTLEILQSFTSTRSAEWGDILFDFLGLFVYFLIARILSKRKSIK
tara:strand:- start:2473 stop:2838 length:366 start_codon:yes stop_codon:yes gene_type:complete